MPLTTTGHRLQRMPGSTALDPRLFAVPRLDPQGIVSAGMQGFDRSRQMRMDDLRRQAAEMELEGVQDTREQQQEQRQREELLRGRLSDLMNEARLGPVDPETGEPTGEAFQGFADPTEQRMFETVSGLERMTGVRHEELPIQTIQQVLMSAGQEPGLEEMDLPGGARGVYDPVNRRMLFTSEAEQEPRATEILEEQRAKALMDLDVPRREAERAVKEIEKRALTDEEIGEAALIPLPNHPGSFINRNKPGEIIQEFQDADGNMRLARMTTAPRGDEREDARPSQKVEIGGDEFNLTPREEGRYRAWVLEQEASGWSDAQGFGLPARRRNNAKKSKLNEIIAERTQPTGNLQGADSRRMSAAQGGRQKTVMVGGERMSVPVVRDASDLESIEDMGFYWDADAETLRQKR